MTTHILAVTYKPKEAAVRDGLCGQTIRAVGNTPKKVGDTALLHAWQGAPYHSKWSWRRKDVLSEVDNIIMDQDGVYAWRIHPWDSPFVDRLARLDFIDPPTGLALKAVMEHYHGLLWPVDAQVLRWPTGRRADQLS